MGNTTNHNDIYIYIYIHININYDNTEQRGVEGPASCATSARSPRSGDPRRAGCDRICFVLYTYMYMHVYIYIHI